MLMVIVIPLAAVQAGESFLALQWATGIVDSHSYVDFDVSWRNILPRLMYCDLESV
jgi:hypothetical protein